MVLILRLVLLFYFKLLFLLFKGSFIGKENAEIIENVEHSVPVPGKKRKLKDYKVRYMGIGKVDKDMVLFYEDKKEKEKEEK